MCAKLLQFVWLCTTLWTVADCSLPGSCVHEIFQQESWSGLPCPPLGILCSSPVPQWTPSHLGIPLPVSCLFAFNTVREVLPARILEWFAIFSSNGPHFFQNSSFWPFCLGWPCTVWLIASLSYASPFSTTRLWSMKGITPLNKLLFQILYFSAPEFLFGFYLFIDIH